MLLRAGACRTEIESSVTISRDEGHGSPRTPAFKWCRAKFRTARHIRLTAPLPDKAHGGNSYGF